MVEFDELGGKALMAEVSAMNHANQRRIELRNKEIVLNLVRLVLDNLLISKKARVK